MFLEREYTTTEQKFISEISTVIDDLSVKIYDLEYIVGSKTLRIYVVDPQTNTATIEDCVSVDRALSPYFEETEWIPEEIVLEVSSPGIYRSLHTMEDFDQAVDQSVNCEFKTKLTSEVITCSDSRVLNQKKIIGTLLECDADNLKVSFFDKEYVIPFKNVKKVNIES